MPITQKLQEYVAACFTGLWIQSHEHEDALSEIARLCREQQWQLAVWDVAQGLRVPGQTGEKETEVGDPLAAIRSLNALATPESSALLVLVNFHRFINSAEIIQALAQQIASGKQNRTFLLILSPIVQLPPELERHFVVIQHPLPDREQLNEIARGIATEPGELPEDLSPILDATAGLTRYEAEGAYSLSLVRHGSIQSDAIWELKTQALKRGGLVALHRGGERFDDLGGLDSLKAFCQRSLRSQADTNTRCRPKGVLLLSPPGCGKSAFAKSLGNEMNRPTITLDVGTLYGSLVGDTERNIRQALQTIDAMAPCVCFVDELEKSLSGNNSSQGDSGVSSRLFGSILTWMVRRRTA